MKKAVMKVDGYITCFMIDRAGSWDIDYCLFSISPILNDIGYVIYTNYMWMFLRKVQLYSEAVEYVRDRLISDGYTLEIS